MKRAWSGTRKGYYLQCCPPTTSQSKSRYTKQVWREPNPGKARGQGPDGRVCPCLSHPRSHRCRHTCPPLPLLCLLSRGPSGSLPGLWVDRVPGVDAAPEGSRRIYWGEHGPPDARQPSGEEAGGKWGPAHCGGSINPHNRFGSLALSGKADPAYSPRRGNSSCSGSTLPGLMPTCPRNMDQTFLEVLQRKLKPGPTQVCPPGEGKREVCSYQGG